MIKTDNWLKDGLDILNPKGHPLTQEIKANMGKLCEKLNQIQAAYGHELICNSGYRSPEEQMKINPKAPNSCHTKGAAVDLSDREGRLWNFLTAYTARWQMPMMKEINNDAIATLKPYEYFDIYLEDRTATPTWVHIQIYAPKSGNRIFKP